MYGGRMPDKRPRSYTQQMVSASMAMRAQLETTAKTVSVGTPIDGDDGCVRTDDSCDGLGGCNNTRREGW